MEVGIFKMRLLTVLLAVVALIGLSGQTKARTASDIIEWCDGYPESADPDFCRTGIGVAIQLHSKEDSLVSEGIRVCVPEDIFPGDLAQLVVDWLKAHPETHELALPPTVATAIREQYPCDD